MEGECIFARLGGAPSIDVAVNMFYAKVLADPQVSPYFKTTDMVKQHKYQKAFLTMAFGGPNDYHGKDMTNAHKGMNITSEHYDIVINHLVDTLKELGVQDNLINEIGEAVAPLKEDIIYK